MKPWIAAVGRRRIIAVGLALLPMLLLPVLGIIWLWQNDYLLLWLILSLSLASIGLALNQWAVRREQADLPDSDTGPAPHWTPAAEACWIRIEAIAEAVDPDAYPLSDGSALMRLAREVLNTAAGHFHPDTDRPLLEMTVPHTLAVIERAARELRQEITLHIPFSHQLSLGTMSRASRWRDLYKRHEGWFRAGRAILLPQSAAAAELRRLLGNQAFQHGSRRVQRWLLREYTRKLGYHAIELYGGFARIEETQALERAITTGRVSTEKLPPDSQEPLRILVAGRSNAGKSSLINALFDSPVAQTDCLPDTTTRTNTYQLQVQDEQLALIFDSPGEDGADAPELMKLAEHADLVLWVTAANRPDRASERGLLDQIRTRLARPDRISPPVLVVMTHIDRLRPIRQWSPPYRLSPPEGRKAEQIVAAAQAVAADLAVAEAAVIPVSLLPDHVYNVNDALWATILENQPAAQRVRLLRCLKTRRREEGRQLLWRQLKSTGRLLGLSASDKVPSDRP